MGIVVLGAVFVDIKGYPSDVYIPGGRNAGRVEQMHGGVSRNIVEDIANVELQPTFIGLVDDTGAGADVVRKLKAHKVNTDYIRVTKDGMGTWLAIFDNGGDVVAAISKRPDLRPILSILEEQGDEIISRADSIAFEIDMDKEIVKKVFALAEKYHKPVYAVVSNMSIAVERRDFFRSTHCFVCNQQEAGILFSEDYDDKTPEEMQRLLAARIRSAQIPRMVVTMGAQGAVYATNDGEEGWCPAKKVDVKDTTGAGDAFFAGVTIGLTYGKTMAEACEIGTRLAAQLGRTFLDADTVLEQKAGMNIPEIFRLEGEDGFRQRETAVLAELGKRSGLVIAMGGGCVTRPENYPLLHQNGTIFCLTRDLSRLPISGRPVSQALGAEGLYRRRKPLYEKFADAMIDNDRTVEDAVRQILEVLG